MLITAGGLLLLLIVLIGPVAASLAQARWPRAEPRASLVLWQAIGLASGLATVGALLALACAPIAASLPAALHLLVSRIYQREPLPDFDALHAVFLALALALLTWLIGVTVMSAVRTWTSRRRHRLLLDLVSITMEFPGSQHPVRVIEHPAVIAYCLPGPHARLVITSGAMSLLGTSELAAVLAHEQAHVSEHHDLVTLPFAAWQVALPWLSGIQRAKVAVGQLIEMVADDRACQIYHRHILASALARVGIASAQSDAPIGSLAVADSAVLDRVHRLLEPPQVAPIVRTLAYLGAVGLIVVPTAMLLLAAW